MDPQAAKSKAQDLRTQAERMLKEADELEEDADDREEQVRRLDLEIDETHEKMREAETSGDSDKVAELGAELRRIQADKQKAQTGNSLIL